MNTKTKRAVTIDVEQLQAHIEGVHSDHRDQLRWLGRLFDGISADPNNRAAVYDFASLGQHLTQELAGKAEAARELAEQCGFGAVSTGSEATQ